MRNNPYFFIFLLLYGCVHGLTLARSPLPWFDEVFFASLSRNFWEEGTFFVPNTVIGYEIKLYGFVYFALTGLAQSWAENSVFAFRFVNFCAGMGVAYWLFRSASPTLLALCIFLLDPFFALCLHEGRMDLCATLFILLAYTCLQKNSPTQQALAGLFSVLALLTTPRVAFMGIGLAVLWLANFKKSNLKTIYLQAIAPCIVILGYSLWIFWAYGNVTTFLQSYIQASDAHYQMSAWFWYVGGTGYVPKHQYWLLALILVSICWYLLQKFLASPPSRFASLLSSPIVYDWIFVVSFHLFVRDLGQYSIFILPSYYRLLWHYAGKQTRFAWVVLGLLGAFNGSYFVLKNTQVALTWEMRNPQTAENFVRQHIPQGSKVVGEAMYYYAVRANHCAYQMFEVYEDLPTRERLQREKFGYQYIIVTTHSSWRHKEVVEYYLKQNPKARKIASLKFSPSPTVLWLSRLARLSQNENAGYSADIYKVFE